MSKLKKVRSLQRYFHPCKWNEAYCQWIQFLWSPKKQINGSKFLATVPDGLSPNWRPKTDPIINHHLYTQSRDQEPNPWRIWAHTNWQTDRRVRSGALGPSMNTKICIFKPVENLYLAWQSLRKVRTEPSYQNAHLCHCWHFSLLFRFEETKW